LNQVYYNQCLRPLLESAEICLDEGLALPNGYRTEFDLKGLLRMDQAALFEANGKAIAAGWMSPNEARAMMDMAPVPGGDSPYMQQQNWSLADLATRDIINDKPSVDAPAKPAPDSPAEEDDEETEARVFAALLQKELGDVHNTA
jgi:phage portal protein BeeE